ncbi:MAG: fimbrial protein, partial [Bacteroidales bacterium]
MKKILYIIYTSILLFSCSKPYNFDTNSYSNGSIVLKIKSNDPSLITRATEPGDDLLNENKIENIHIFFFSQNATDNQQCIQYESFSGLSFVGTEVFSKELTTPQNLFTAGVTYDIYTIVNLPANITIPNQITLGTIKSLHTIIPITSTSIQNNFIMDGKVSAVLNPATVTPIVNIDMPLKRAVSKIRVKFIL